MAFVSRMLFFKKWLGLVHIFTTFITDIEANV